jgi:hypothetical protein
MSGERNDRFDDGAAEALAPGREDNEIAGEYSRDICMRCRLAASSESAGKMRGFSE